MVYAFIEGCIIGLMVYGTCLFIAFLWAMGMHFWETYID